MWKSADVEVTATAPRIRQIEQVQRRAEANPSVSVTVNRTAPQWHAPLNRTGCDDLQSIVIEAARKAQVAVCAVRSSTVSFFAQPP
jgi:hypothetical protein